MNRSPIDNSIRPDFHLPTKIFIEPDILKSAGSIIPPMGSRTVVITTAGDFAAFGQVIEELSLALKEANCGCIIFDELPAVPTTEDIDAAAAYLKKTHSNCIIGFGGLNSINAARAVSLLITNYVFCNDLFDYPHLRDAPMPFISIPVYPIMGYEIAPVFFVNEIHELTKKTYWNYALYPTATIIDPAISIIAPEDKVIRMAISSLAVAAESIISKSNNDIINTYSLKSIDMIFRNLSAAYREPQNIVPRTYLATSSVMTGIAFSVAMLSLTMAISLALASKTGAEIENMMCVILPHVMEFNLTSSPGKYVQMSKVMGEDVRKITVIEAAIKAVEAIRKIESDVDVPQRLSNYNISKGIFKDIADIAIEYPFIKTTPREINTNEIETILIAAY
jgi:alcohol dehydrogenase class IV